MGLKNPSLRLFFNLKCENNQLCLFNSNSFNQLRKSGHVWQGDIIDAHVGLIRIRDEVLGETAADVDTHQKCPYNGGIRQIQFRCQVLQKLFCCLMHVEDVL